MILFFAIEFSGQKDPYNNQYRTDYYCVMLMRIRYRKRLKSDLDDSGVTPPCEPLT